MNLRRTFIIFAAMAVFFGCDFLGNSESGNPQEDGLITETDYVDLFLSDEGTHLSYDENNGILDICYENRDIPDIKNGNAIVLNEEYGFDIRVIDDIHISGDTLTLQTSQGNMCDLFRNIKFTLATSGAAPTRSPDATPVIMPSTIGYIDNDGKYIEAYNVTRTDSEDIFTNDSELWTFHKDFNGKDIWNGKAGRVYWETCSFDAGLNGRFSFDFGERKITDVKSKGQLNKFEYRLEGSIDLDLLLKYHYDIEYSEEKDELEKEAIASVVFKFIVGSVPVYLQVDTRMGKYSEFSAKGSIEASTGVQLGTTLTFGAEYVKGAGISMSEPEFDPHFDVYTPTLEVQASMDAKVSYYPHIDIRIYKFLGPWFELRPFISQEIKAGLQASADGNNHIGWNAETASGLDYQLGLNLQFGIWEPEIWKSDKIELIKNPVFNAPERITTISPQIGTDVEAGKPINVEFLVESYSPLTQKYYPCPFALVNLAADGGTLGNIWTMTDADGKTSTIWTPDVSGTIADPDPPGTDKPSCSLTGKIVDNEGTIIDDAVINIRDDRWVDLGLSVLWARYNVGATSPEEYGGYYAWGETENIYTWENYWENYKYATKDSDGDLIYEYIGSNISGTGYDVAHVKWGDGARMPKLSEIQELVEKCSWSISTHNGVRGCKVTGTNGEHIFLPFATRSGGEFDDINYNGAYWSGTCGCKDEFLVEETDFAYALVFVNERYAIYSVERCGGLSVRPVKEK